MLNVKNFQKFAALVATFLFIASFYSASVAKAQDTLCPPGYSFRSFTIPIGNCEWHCTICANCTYVTHPKVDLRNLRISSTPECLATSDLNQVADYIWDQISNPAFIYNNLCFWPPEVLPCGQGSLEITMEHDNCYKASLEVDGWGGTIMIFRPCPGSTKCTEIVSWCWDPSKGIYRMTQVSHNGSLPNCEFDITDPRVNLPQIIGNPPSNCFKVKNICNP